MSGTVPFGCGQCLPCRINRRRQWMVRQVLESYGHEENCFVTLTYDEEHLPEGNGLSKRDVQLFLKKLRKAYYPRPIRFFACGEYGPATRRPHYHLSLFGLSSSSFDTYHCRPCEWHVARCWAKGFVSVGDFTAETAQYVAGYVVKKIEDRHIQHPVPEFALMSRRPGIGAGAAVVIAKSLHSRHLAWETGDVPASVRINGRTLNLGRYLLRKLRQEVGFTDEYIKEMASAKTFETSLEMLGLYEASETALTVTQAYKEANAQKIRQLTAKDKIRKQTRTL